MIQTSMLTQPMILIICVTKIKFLLSDLKV